MFLIISLLKLFLEDGGKRVLLISVERGKRARIECIPDHEKVSFTPEEIHVSVVVSSGLPSQLFSTAEVSDQR